jgi:hypothetical protein
MMSPTVIETKHLSPHASVSVVVVSSGHVLATIPASGVSKGKLL